MQTRVERMPRRGRPKMIYYFGLDIGNGNIKVAGDNVYERVPSYRAKNVFASDGLGSVELENEKFVVGEGALISRQMLLRTVDRNTGKTDEIEKLYFGALAHIGELPKVLVSRVVVSSHAWKTNKQQIKDNLNQERKVVLSGKPITVKTEVLLVVPEGYGAVYSKKEPVATFDFGKGTTTFTPYLKGKPLDAVVKHFGTQRLDSLISENMKVINGGYPGNEELIMKALERGELRVDGLNIKNIYQQALAQWWQQGLNELAKLASRYLADGYRIICIGGGVALPGFSNILTKKGFEPVLERPEMANAKGLYELALIKAKQLGHKIDSSSPQERIENGQATLGSGYAAG